MTVSPYIKYLRVDAMQGEGAVGDFRRLNDGVQDPRHDSCTDIKRFPVGAMQGG